MRPTRVAAAVLFSALLSSCGGGSGGAASPAALPPGAPTGLVATASGVSSVTLAWTGPGGTVSGFEVERAASADGPWSQVGAPPASASGYQDAGLAPATTYQYRVRARNDAGVSAWSAIASATTAGPPPPATITGQPADQFVPVGATASFQVTAADASGYQWQVSTDGGAVFSDIAGATAAAYSTPATTLVDSGKRVRVVVAGAGGSATSAIATLVVIEPVSAPVILVQPAPQVAVAGQRPAFTVTAEGASVGYLWYRSTDGGATFSAVPGGSAATLTLAAVLESDSGQQFRVVVSNGGGSVTSAAALLTVGPSLAPTFVTQPSQVAVVVPATGTFSVAVSGTPAPTIQWQMNADGTGKDFVDLDLATSDVYTTFPTTLADNGHLFRAVATNANGVATSDVVMLRVRAPRAPAITAQPVGVSVEPGHLARFSVTVTGAPTPALQWQESRDGGGSWADLKGATGSAWTSPAHPLDGGQYRVVASNASGTVTSDAAVLTVLPTLPRIIFSRSVDGQANLYRVREDGTGLVALADSTDPETFHSVVGDRVLYYRRGAAGTDVYGVNADGTATTLLATSALILHCDGVRVFYYRDPGLLYSVNLDGSGTLLLTSNMNLDFFWGVTATGRAIYSPINASRQLDLSSVRFDGTDDRPLAYGISYVHAMTAGGRLIYRRASGSDPDTACSDLLSINDDGTGQASLATSADCETFLGLGVGDRVIYERRSGGQFDLYSVAADGTGTVPLATTSADERAAWVTSAGQLIFHDVVNTYSEFYLINLDGTGKVNLTQGRGDFHYLPAEDGDGRLIFSVVSDHLYGLHDLFAVSADGSGRVALTSGIDGKSLLSRTDDGRVIYVSEVLVWNNHGEPVDLVGYDLYSVLPDGTGTTLLATSRMPESFLGIAGGDRIIYRTGEWLGPADLYSVKSDGTGGVALAVSPDHEKLEAITATGRVIFSRTGQLLSVKADGTGAADLAPAAEPATFIKAF